MKTPEIKIGRRKLIAGLGGLAGLCVASKLLPESGSASAASTPVSSPERKKTVFDDTAWVLSASNPVGTPVPERKGLVDSSFIDLTAPTFASQCGTPEINPDNNPNHWSIKNNRLIGVFVGFADQTSGLADLNSGMYHDLLADKGRIVHYFYNHFMGINFTIESMPGFVMARRDYGFYSVFTGGDGGGSLIDELLERNVFPYKYDGQRYPIMNIIPCQNLTTITGIGGLALLGQANDSFGVAMTPGKMLYRSDNFNHVIVHENGHALGLPHNTNRKSIMNPGNYDVLSTLLDSTDIQKLCSNTTTAPTPTPVVSNGRMYIPVAPRRSNP